MHSTSFAYPRTKRAARWPLKADFKTIGRDDAKSLVAEFGALFDLDTLRSHGNFMHMRYSSVRNFDNYDLLTAIQFMTDYLFDDASAHTDTERKNLLIKRLEAACGPLNKPIALNVDGRHCAFTPARA